MRSWAMAAAVAAWTQAIGCVIYKDDAEWITGGDESSTWTSSTTPGTDPGPADGRLEVDWQLGSSGCEAAGIATVEVAVGGMAWAFACTDGTAVVDVPAGRHELVLTGIDADGAPRYSGDGGRVRVRAGQLSTAPTVVLSALPASLSASWFFDDGHLCAANGVDLVEANLFDENDVVQASAEVECDVGVLSFDEVEPGAYVLLLLGRDEDGAVSYSAELQLAVQPGDQLGFDLMLAPSP
jgi:hypothetical protein